MKAILFSVMLMFGHGDYQGVTELSFGGETPYVQETAQVVGRYVHVYGRKSCGNTTRMMKHLKDARIPYRFYSVDDSNVSKRLHGKMQAAGLRTSSYYLPVMDVNGKMAVNPPPEAVVSFYSQ